MRPSDVQTHARRAAVAAGLAGGSALVAGLLASVGGDPVSPISRWRFLDAAVMAASAWGFSRRSRAAAAGCLAYFVSSRALLWLEFGRGREALVSVALLGYFLVQGARAAFAAHRTPPIGLRPPAV